jgi:hypothetical protein
MARKKTPTKRARPVPPPVTGLDVPVSYKTVFWVAVILTAASLAAAIYLATQPRDAQTDTLREVAQTCQTTWKTGFGVIIGLLGGKRLP